MALKRVTMQDIADACGLSRNTVSKIFNGRGAVPEATRKLVLDTARALGYAQQPEEAGRGGSIALLTQHKLLSHSFGAFFITSFTDQISRSGHTVKIYELSPEEIANRSLPPHLKLEETEGFLGIELFDRAYQEKLCALGKPTVFVDGYAHAAGSLMDCDFISMENLAAESALVRRMLDSGARSVGFVGDPEHCSSFYERYVALCLTLGEVGLAVDRAQCILDRDSEEYGNTEWLVKKLTAMPALPDAFACANDYLAIHLMTALKRLGLTVPSDVMITGFDGSLDASLCEPTLTTARIPSSEIGRLAASLLFERLRDPGLPFRRVYVKTSPVWGGSTR